jgi:hypothetical protein
MADDGTASSLGSFGTAMSDTRRSVAAASDSPCRAWRVITGAVEIGGRRVKLDTRHGCQVGARR